MHFLVLIFLLVSSTVYAQPSQVSAVALSQENYASLMAKLESLQRENLELKGALEANRFIVENTQREQSKGYQDLDMRMLAQEERMKILLVQVEKVLAKSSPQLADENRLYQAALDKVGEGSYLEAAASFTRFLERYPKSTFAAQANFWIAESYFEVRDYQRAIKEYQTVQTKYPKDEKARQSLLRQGECFIKLGMKDEAKLFLQKVQSDYPQSMQSAEATRFLESLEQPTPLQPSALPMNTYPEKTLQEQRSQQSNVPPSSPAPSPAAQPPGIVR